MTISTTTSILTSALLLASSTAVFAEEGDMTRTRDHNQDGTMEQAQTRTQEHQNTNFDLYTPDASSLQALNREQNMTRNQNRYMNASANVSMTENSATMGNGSGNMQSRQGQAGQSMQARPASRSMNTSMNTYRNNSMARSAQSSTQSSAASGSMTQQNTASRSMSGGRR